VIAGPACRTEARRDVRGAHAGERLLRLALLAAILGACTAAPDRSSPAPAAASPSPEMTPATAAPSPAASAPGAGSPAPGPPLATLDGLDAGPAIPGRLGSYVWDGSGSEAPWLAGPSAGAARRGAPLGVGFAGAVPVRWQARWAPVEGATVGAPGDGGSGTTAAVILEAPRTGDAWSLAVTAWFGTGRNATWTWEIRVRP
jgi:hypothetical protein